MGRVIYHDFQPHDVTCSLEFPCLACRREIEAELREIDAEIANAQEDEE